jgi:hypothetical protein
MPKKNWIFLVLLLTATSCLPDTWGDEPEPPGPIPWTEILDVTMNPDTVALGQPVEIKVRIKDSLVVGVSYHWVIDSLITSNIPAIRYVPNIPIEWIPLRFPTDTSISRQFVQLGVAPPRGNTGNPAYKEFYIKLKK